MSSLSATRATLATLSTIYIIWMEDTETSFLYITNLKMLNSQIWKSGQLSNIPYLAHEILYNLSRELNTSSFPDPKHDLRSQRQMRVPVYQSHFTMHS